MGDSSEVDGSANLFAPIQAPHLKSISRKDVQAFLLARASYEHSVDAQPGLKPVSYRSCFDADYLEALVMAEAFGADIDDVSKCTDEILRSKLHDMVNDTVPVDFDQALVDVKKNIRMNADEDNARTRVLMLNTSYLRFCKKRGWSFYKDAQKAAVHHICSVLQPPALRDRVESALRLEKESLKRDYRGFMKFLSDEAELCERYNPLRKYKQTQKNTSGGKKSSDGNNQSSVTTDHSSEKPKTSPQNKPNTAGSSRVTRKPPLCLVPGCGKFEFVRDHEPKLSDAEQKRLIDEYKRKKAISNSAQKTKFAALRVMTPTQTSGSSQELSAKRRDSTAVVPAELYGFKVACRIDTGSDLSAAISSSIIKFLDSKGVFVATRGIRTVKDLIAADGRKINNNGEAQICPLIQTAAGPLRLRNINVRIIDSEDDDASAGYDCAGEIFLGNPLLQAAGLHVKDFFADQIDHLASVDFGTILTEEPLAKIGKLGKALSGTNRDINSESSELSIAEKVSSTILSDVDDIDYKDVDIGVVDLDVVHQEIQSMTDRSVSSVSSDEEMLLKSLTEEFKDIFRVRLGADPPVDVPPMEIKFEQKERPVKVKQRSYSPRQMEFLKSKVEELVDAKFIFRNNASKWACAPLVVPKSGEEGFRFTVDLRPVNAQTKRNVWPMPNTEAMLSTLAGSKVWFNLDFLHGYWQFPLSKSSQECQSFHTPFGVFTPTRVLHGATNAVAYFQSSMESIFGHLDLLIYLDDILGSAPNTQLLLERLRAVFTVCKEKGLKLNPKKCQLVTQEVQFCGRIINKDGVQFHPRQYEALINMQTPKTVGALMELVHGANWMRTALPGFSKLISPLQVLLESNYVLNKTRKKIRLANRPISAWGDEHQQAFTCLIQAIKDQVVLATPDPQRRLCLFTDASEEFWSGVLTQVTMNEFQSDKPPQDWNHQPISFVSGSFKGSAARWTMPEKESYAIIASVIRLAHILVVCGEFSIFTDHKNILYMMAPTRFQANVARHIAHKVQRWAIRLSEFHYTVEHIPGHCNIWADMLTRWAAPGYSKYPARKMGAIRVPLITEERPDLPTLKAIAESQRRYPPSDREIESYNLKKLSASPEFQKLHALSSEQLQSEGDAWISDDGKLYIPKEDEEIQLRIIVAAHCGFGGHRGYTSTVKLMKEKVFWKTLDSDVKFFVQGCFICLLSDSGQKVPRPLGHQLHADKVGELLHFDYLYIGESKNAKEYILILKDDFSGYVFLRACKHADAETTAEVLLEYFTTFTPVLTWFSDQGTHFKNNVMELLAKSLGARHLFSTAYVPWSNGTVESVCKQILRVMRAFSAEYMVPETEWPTTVPAIQSIINNSPSRRLGDRAPITVHTGIESGNPLHLALTSIGYLDATSANEAGSLQRLRIEELHDALDVIHKEVSCTLSESRKMAVDRHNAKTHIRHCNLSVGDFVVVARHRGARTKMSSNWVGPRRVVGVLSDFTYKIENLITLETESVHISRIKHYMDSLIGKSVEMRELAESADRVWYSVDKVCDLRKENGNFEVLVAWKGLSQASSSWEPLAHIFEDVPSKVRAFFKKRRSNALTTAAKKAIAL